MSHDKITLLSRDVEQTIALGHALGAHLSQGTVVALIGTLGTGKTHLIKGLAQGLAVPEDELVTSPTFTLINEYNGRLPVFHIDAYRLENAQQLEAIGFDEICDARSVVVVEWADRVWPLVGEYRPLCVRLHHQGPTERRIEFEPVNDETQTALRQVADICSDDAEQ